ELRSCKGPRVRYPDAPAGGDRAARVFAAGARGRHFVAALPGPSPAKSAGRYRRAPNLRACRRRRILGHRLGEGEPGGPKRKRRGRRVDAPERDTPLGRRYFQCIRAGRALARRDVSLALTFQNRSTVNTWNTPVNTSGTPGQATHGTPVTWNA